LSLGLNLFLGGMIASKWIFGSPPTIEQFVRPFDRRAGLEVLDPASRDRVEAIWRDNRSEVRSKARAIHEARRAVKRALVADPFDQDAFTAAQRELASRSEAFRTMMNARLADIAEALPADKRKAYFEATFVGPSRRGPHHGH
jgi:Spy/CpxP family protein refolding chaperone